MKLQNKKTGVVVDVEIRDALYDNIAKFKLINKATGSIIAMYNSLAEFNAEWKDYEEPNPYFVSEFGDVYPVIGIALEKKHIEKLKEIGNYFETKEEAEKAVEKLKAQKRLKDKGFRFTGFDGGGTYIDFTFDKSGEPGSAYKDLDLLFGGEE